VSEPETYEVFAVRYGSRAERLRRESFITTDAHDAPMPLDYYVWAIVNPNRAIVVDTGFEHTEAARRGRVLTRLPREGLAMLGIDTATVRDVVITHLHFDHAGTLDDFPAARFHLQDLELQFGTGRHMTERFFRQAYALDHVLGVVRKVFAGRVAFHDGAEEIAPGVSVHLIGGHTPGMQCVRVLTRRGHVVLASDAAHFYENMETASPFPIVYDVARMIAGYDVLRGLAASPAHVIPGHDPLVMARYPAPEARLNGVIARLDVPPRA